MVEQFSGDKDQMEVPNFDCNDGIIALDFLHLIKKRGLFAMLQGSIHTLRYHCSFNLHIKWHELILFKVVFFNQGT